MNNVFELRRRVAELRGWTDITILMPTCELIGTSPSGMIGKPVPDYTGKSESAEVLRQVMVKAGYWAAVREPKIPGEPYRITVINAGWAMPEPPLPGGKYEGETREIVICKAFIPWAEWMMQEREREELT